MNVCSLNINGLEEKEEEVRLFIKSGIPDIIFLQETKTRRDTFKNDFNYPGKYFLNKI